MTRRLPIPPAETPEARSWFEATLERGAEKRRAEQRRRLQARVRELEAMRVRRMTAAANGGPAKRNDPLLTLAGIRQDVIRDAVARAKAARVRG